MDIYFNVGDFMPSNVIPIEKSKKHYTKAEETARKTAENSIKRSFVSIMKPDYVRANRRADYY